MILDRPSASIVDQTSATRTTVSSLASAEMLALGAEEAWQYRAICHHSKPSFVDGLHHGQPRSVPASCHQPNERHLARSRNGIGKADPNCRRKAIARPCHRRRSISNLWG